MGEADREFEATARRFAAAASELPHEWRDKYLQAGIGALRAIAFLYGPVPVPPGPRPVHTAAAQCPRCGAPISIVLG
jgi:hypothetical protein